MYIYIIMYMYLNTDTGKQNPPKKPKKMDSGIILVASGE